MIQVKLDRKAKSVIAKTADFSGGSGGPIIVTELPQVGEEHTVYELHETKIADFPWLFTEIDESGGYPQPSDPLVVVENEEDVTYENLKIRSIEPMATVGVYVKATNKVYQCWWEEAEIGEQGAPDYFFQKEEIIPKQDILYGIGKTLFVILKDFDYHISSGEESDFLDGTGHFLNGAEFVYDGYDVVPLVLTNATNKKIGLDTKETLVGTFEPEFIPDFVKQVIKIDLSLLDQEVVFVPQPKRTIESYWIYTNSEWVNIDDIKAPSTSLGVTYSNIRDLLPPTVNNAIDIYYGEEKLEINDYYVFSPVTEEPSPSVAYATVSGFPQLTSETHQFVIKVCPKMLVNTERDRLCISINGNIDYQSQWRETIPSEIEVTVEGICQINIYVEQMPL